MVVYLNLEVAIQLWILDAACKVWQTANLYNEPVCLPAVQMWHEEWGAQAMPLTQARWLFSRATGVHGTRTSRMTTYHTDVLMTWTESYHCLCRHTRKQTSAQTSKGRQWTDLHAVHGHRGQVVGVLFVPAEAEQRVVLGVLIDDGAVLQVPEVKHADWAVSTHRGKHISTSSCATESNVVDLKGQIKFNSSFLLCAQSTYKRSHFDVNT